MELPRTLPDFEARAAEVLPEGPYGYYVGGAGDEVTLRDNVDSWRRIAVRPRMMVDVSQRDASTTVLGQEYPHPILIAPTAFHALAQRPLLDSGSGQRLGQADRAHRP